MDILFLRFVPHDPFVCFIYCTMKKKASPEDRKRSKVAAALKLPQDILYREATLSLCGRRSLYIENFKGIVAFQPECICVQLKDSRLWVRGKGLSMVYYTEEQLQLTGWITEISYEG